MHISTARPGELRMPRAILTATFSDADRLLQAVRAVRQENFPIYDVYTPYPVHNMDNAMGIRRTRLPRVTLAFGALGLFFALLLQFGAAVFDWPLNVGGKPDNSTLAFIPISFELTILAGSLATVAALFLRARLYPGMRRNVIAGNTWNENFVLVLRRRDASFDICRARSLLEQHGATSIEEGTAEL